MYKKEGHEQFTSLRNHIRTTIARTIFHIAPVENSYNGTSSSKNDLTLNTSRPDTVMSKALGNKRKEVVATQKLGRNDPCWCNSGKKFKRCHGLI